MRVYFVSKKTGTTVINCPEIGDKHSIRFINGKYSTTDKQEIFKLLNDPYAQKYVSLTPGQDLKEINNYIMSSELPSTLDREFLDKIPFEAWKEIMEVKDLNVSFPLVEIAKAKLLGSPMDNDLQLIFMKYAKEDEELSEALNEKLSPVSTTEETETKDPAPKPSLKSKKKIKVPTKDPENEFDEAVQSIEELGVSTEYGVHEAGEIIQNHTLEQLEEFIPEDEDRKTVFKYWNEQFPDNQIEVPE